MSTEFQINTIGQKVEELLANEPGYFLVDIRITAGSNVKVFIDADQGASIDRLVQFNRALYKQIDGTGLFPEDNFALEVSSPGLDEPLKLERQYLKNIGRFVEVTTKEDIKIEGKLIAKEETDIIIEEERGKGKKKETIQHTVLFDNIKSTKIQIKF